MTTLPHEAFARFQELIERAKQTGLREPTAMTLATAGADGRVSARVVLLRGFDERGFVFYTNLSSEKALQMQANPSVAICFHWESLGEQVRIEGHAALVPNDEADAYWQSRPRDSQIGAWASRQSETLDARETLEQRIAKIELEFLGNEVPRPEFWSGYRVVARRIEFWSNRSARLHERVVYELRDGEWATRMLYP
ncbi:MAG: pyridoxamine 5'-phosphate oxidase [Planctomycetales bacterium]|nr:pyridoxamine 5'-phosphate oxidase [Planctomycetales bacterium]